MTSSASPRLNVDLLEEKYTAWQNAPASVGENWAAFFEGFELGSAQLKRKAVTDPQTKSSTPAQSTSDEELTIRGKTGAMVYAYRTIGHTAAWINPLEEAPPDVMALDIEEFGFSQEDLDTPVASQYYRNGEYMSLRELRAELQRVFCGQIGFEFMHIHNREVRNWLRDHIESQLQSQSRDASAKEQAFRAVTAAETFERFLHKKFPGEKRFSLEGGESLMVALDTILENGPSLGIDEVLMGMAHRGRLNVLANFLGKSLKVLLYEFQQNYVPNLVAGDGDVKYHLGYESERVNSLDEKVDIKLSANPSHLEAVDAVVEGKARARQRQLGDTAQRKKVLPVLIHGDAAFAGQGLVAEVLNLSQLRGYRTGGTVHLIVNNQIGFTTMPEDARSSDYCTDVAKMIEAPVFHVNGDYPLEVLRATELALEFRQKFGRDVIIDIVCYRRHGHNEGDEPEFTQPLVYRKLKKHGSVVEHYGRRLQEAGDFTMAELEAISQEFESRLEKELGELKELEQSGDGHPHMESTAIDQPDFNYNAVSTGVPVDTLREIGVKLSETPDDFHVHDKLKRRFLDKRREAAEAGGPFNWSFAEALAFGTLLTEKHSVRLSGQDCRRGTFSQRHAVLYDTVTRDRYIALQHLSEDQGQMCVYNSLLSEAAVLGFDYGYSLVAPEMLIMWEAQFGDFANGAQVIIDQFIASAESKWSRPSRIVLLLPHGYEGMGPEHSSARLERFLQLCADQNMQVANLTTPAQYFHILRRQVIREVAKPLVLMTPKSLLGLPECVSTVDDLATGTYFHEILDDYRRPCVPGDVNRIVFCSGKVYYDLLAHRTKEELDDTVIVRIEQLYPLHQDRLMQVVGQYEHAHKWVWCQEEPLNMGAWSYIGPRLQKLTPYKIRYAGRDRASSPATGAKTIHKLEQKKLVQQAFTL
ncbi:MAG: 2-oxoglutarate dehydrogenase E1 component [Verrucomicrobiales bacterium]|nr:2-oxoglutarate dehydrogenase E1 component [Verrucomicrobiales bacterium]